jgi:hypothetical protein
LKRNNFICGILGATVVAASLFAMQSSPGRKSPGRKVSGGASPTPNQTLDTEVPSDTSKEGASPTQLRELVFSRLRVEEAERQAKGNAKEEDVIQAQERVFRDAESWRAFWSPYKDRQVPEVDFKKRYVAAVFLGAKPSPGYGVEISKIVYDPREKLTVVNVVELLPDPEMAYLGVNVYPSDIVAFPAQPGEVVFKRTRRIPAK